MTSAHAQANVDPGPPRSGPPSPLATAAEDAPVPVSPLSRVDDMQREMQQLREMVFAMSREIAAEKARGDLLQATLDTWESRDDPGEDAEEEVPAQAPMAAAPWSTPARRYIGSPGERDQPPDDYDWMQAADPWRSPTAPPHMPPGMATSAAPEQWTDRADAQDDWWPKGDNGW